MGDDELGPAVADSVTDGFRGEPAEHYGVNRAKAGAGEHGDGGLGDHAHVDDRAFAFLESKFTEGVGRFADLRVKLLVRDLPRVPGLVAFPKDRDLVAALGEVAVDARLGRVEGSVGEPT